MKKRLALALAVASISATATVALAGTGAGTGINGSWHDLNSALFSGFKHDKFERTCVFCHTPHNARTNATDALSPLWNHADNKLDLTGRPYQWVAPTNKSIKIANDPLIGPSRLCMACHDGSTAVDAHGSAGWENNGTQDMSYATYNDNLEGTHTNKRYIDDLTVTHPIGFKYDDAVTARNTGPIPELITKDQGFINYPIDGSTWNTQNRKSTDGTALPTTSKKIQDTLYGKGGYMTCATCHEVHNTLNARPNTQGAYNYFLYAQEEGSAICLSCHVK